KYALTQAGIQQAFTDACAGTFGGFVKGTFVFLPPMNSTFATGWTITCPVHLIGAGLGQTTITVSSGAAFTLSPSANFAQNQDWEIAGVDAIASASDVIVFSDANGFPLNHLRVHDNELVSGSASSFAVKYAGTIANGGFDWKITNNIFASGISITHDTVAHGLEDGLLIADNTFL